MPRKDLNLRKLYAKQYYENNKEKLLEKQKIAKLKKIENATEEEKIDLINKRREIGLRSYYKHHDKNKNNRREKSFIYALKNLYNITLDEYNKLLENQNYCCAICKNKNAKRWTSSRLPLAVDHCHKSREIRGLLCDNCNVMLGHSKDSIDILNNAINYLNEFRNK